MLLTAGARLGPYEIVAPLGTGGMGEVYRARDPRLQRDVAIKVLPEGIVADARDRLQREARAASALTHPNICAVYDLGEAGGRLFLVMELVEGMTLREYGGKNPMDPAEVISIGTQIADALEAAHAKGVIHRDIKSGNIMVTPRCHVKVLDFGLARQIPADDADLTRTAASLTATGTVMGTPHYISPEVLQGNVADVRSDLWSLGVVLYELLTGKLPFEGATMFEVISAILREAPRPLPASVRPELRRIVERCLAKRSQERFQRAAEVRAALVKLQRIPVQVPPSRKWMIRAPAIALAAAILWLVVLRPGSQTVGRLTSTGAPASMNREANDAFELALQFQRVQNDIPRAQQTLERALAVDPHFAEALRYHALDYVINIQNGYSNDASVLYRAEEELRRASQIAPELPSLPSAFTAVYLMQGRPELVPTEALNRIVQTSRHRDSLLWLAILSWLSEDNEGVKRLTNRILEQEPLFGPPRTFLGEILRTEGDIRGAIREQQRVLEQAPGNISAVRLLTLAYMDAGELDNGRNLLESKRPEFEKNYMWRSARALLLAREGKRQEALDALDEETLKFLSTVYYATSDAAEFYALVGNVPKAIEWFERTVRNGDQRIAWFRRDPRLSAIGQDPRFQSIVETVEARRKLQTGSR